MGELLPFPEHLPTRAEWRAAWVQPLRWLEPPPVEVTLSCDLEAHIAKRMRHYARLVRRPGQPLPTMPVAGKPHIRRRVR
jgi:hypothetical protein